MLLRSLLILQFFSPNKICSLYMLKLIRIHLGWMLRRKFHNRVHTSYELLATGCSGAAFLRLEVRSAPSTRNMPLDKCPSDAGLLDSPETTYRKLPYSINPKPERWLLQELYPNNNNNQSPIIRWFKIIEYADEKKDIPLLLNLPLNSHGRGETNCLQSF